MAYHDPYPQRPAPDHFVRRWLFITACVAALMLFWQFLPAIPRPRLIESKAVLVELYGRRWDIEVFFKMAKSFLNLAKEFQGRSFDALVAHATLVCCRYIMLELTRRTNTDPRTLGTLFHAVCDEMRQIGFTEALALLLKMLEEALQGVVGFSKEQIQRLIERFIETLPRTFRERLVFLAPMPA